MIATAVIEPHLIHYLPIATTVLSAVFCFILLRRYRLKGKGAHLIWWAVGVFFYGVGTGLESAVTLFGNSPLLNKTWYVAGALLGGYPLATGTVYLLLRRSTAHILTGLTLPIVVVLSVFVMLSPIKMEELLSHKPGGDALAWTWVRMFTPLVNGYAALFLIGGAILSAWRFAKKRATLDRAIGNTLIAVGAILPGIGGGMAKAGIVEGLYVGEFVGIILIWIGYAYCVRKKHPANPEASQETMSNRSLQPQHA